MIPLTLSAAHMSQKSSDPVPAAAGVVLAGADPKPRMSPSLAVALAGEGAAAWAGARAGVGAWAWAGGVATGELTATGEAAGTDGASKERRETFMNTFPLKRGAFAPGLF